MDAGFLLGNTSLRMALLERGRLAWTAAVEWKDASRGVEALRDALGGRPLGGAAAASVRDDLLAPLERELGGLATPLRLARRDFEVPIPSLYDDPAEAGVDRLVNVLAARRRLPGRAAVVVDWGTAVSISVLTREGEFGGGLIACGAPAVEAGLRAAAPRLPDAQPQRLASFIQRSTRGALAMGLHSQLAGGVRAMVCGVLAELGEPRAAVLATGGGAERLAPGVPEVDQVIPHLAMEGLFLAALGDGALAP